MGEPHGAASAADAQRRIASSERTYGARALLAEGSLPPRGTPSPLGARRRVALVQRVQRVLEHVRERVALGGDGDEGGEEDVLVRL